jgi:hypothetical protein
MVSWLCGVLAELSAALPPQPAVASERAKIETTTAVRMRMNLTPL